MSEAETGSQDHHSHRAQAMALALELYEYARHASPLDSVTLRGFGASIVRVAASMESQAHPGPYERPVTPKPELPLPQLFASLPDIQLMPRPSPPGESMVLVEIVNRNTIRIAGTQLSLNRNETFCLGALMIHADKALNYVDMEKLGFAKSRRSKGAAHTAFRTALRRLTEFYEEPLVIGHGHTKARNYHLNPNLVFVDLRTDEERRAFATGQ